MLLQSVNIMHPYGEKCNFLNLNVFNSNKTLFYDQECILADAG